jgi:hypothetical protein
MDNIGIGYGYGDDPLPVLNTPNVDNAPANEIRDYIHNLANNTSTYTNRKKLGEFLRRLVEARPGEFNGTLQQLLAFEPIPRETLLTLLRASNGEISLAGVVLEYNDPTRNRNMFPRANQDIPGTLEEDDTGRGKRRRRRSATKKRRKNSRKSRRSRRHRRRA